MTISNTVASVTHLGNGVNTLWAYWFKIPDIDSIVVTIIGSDNTETVLDPLTFSTSGIGSDTGGVVTYPLTGSPLAGGNSIRIDRAVTLSQTTAFSNQSGLINSLVESAFDKLTMIAQDTKAVSSRAIGAVKNVIGYANAAAASALAAATSASSANTDAAFVANALAVMDIPSTSTVMAWRMRKALAADGTLWTVLNSPIFPGDPTDPVAIAWTCAAPITPGDQIATLIQTITSKTDAQMVALFALARTQTL